MNHELPIGVFVSVFVLEFAAFGMQRATLLMSREAGVPYQITKWLLPFWFPAVWVLRITKWGTLLFIAFSWSWGLAVALLLADVVLSAVLPIPYRLYVPSFRKRIAQIKKYDEKAAEHLESILNSSKIHGT